MNDDESVAVAGLPGPKGNSLLGFKKQDSFAPTLFKCVDSATLVFKYEKIPRGRRERRCCPAKMQPKKRSKMFGELVN